MQVRAFKNTECKSRFGGQVYMRKDGLRILTERVTFTYKMGEKYKKTHLVSILFNIHYKKLNNERQDIIDPKAENGTFWQLRLN